MRIGRIGSLLLLLKLKKVSLPSFAYMVVGSNIGGGGSKYSGVGPPIIGGGAPKYRGGGMLTSIFNATNFSVKSRAQGKN
jgi:hypothetical protein